MEIAALTEELSRMHVENMRQLYQIGTFVGSQGESGVLLSLYWEKRPMLAGEFVNLLGLTTGRIANILKRLEEKGLIQRRADREDGRHVVVNLTGSGAALAAEEYRRIEEAHRSLLTYLGPGDAEECVRLARRLVKYVDEI